MGHGVLALPRDALEEEPQSTTRRTTVGRSDLELHQFLDDLGNGTVRPHDRWPSVATQLKQKLVDL